MKLHTIALLAALQLSGVHASNNQARHARILNRRQGTSQSGSSSAAPSSTSTSTSTSSTVIQIQTSTSISSPPPATPTPQTTQAPSGTPNVSIPGGPSVSVTTTTGPPPLATGTEIPPLANITLGMPTRAPLPVTANYAPGATPPVSGAPVLPTAFVFQKADWPDQDKVPLTDSSEVAVWLKELDGFYIPDIAPTVDGSCSGDPAAAADAANRGWWTCGGHVRSTDITQCPDKFTWGVSFDDGPSGYTQHLLNYLDEKKLSATFFVVGSRVIERPAVLIEEYMTGHEISVHTWSHRPLTSLTTAQVVAELGWTRKAIKTVLGVTPTTMRPPYGDIDDRVRAIALAMGMVPIMWTRTPSGGVFDTNDWRVAGGIVNGTDSFNTFQTILTNASSIETGFIVLQHDLFEITVDLATGYTLNAALTHNPPFNLKPIGQCIKVPTTNLYLESNKNTSFPYTNHTAGGVDTDGDGKVDTKSGDGGTTSISAGVAFSVSPLSLLSLVGGATFASLF